MWGVPGRGRHGRLRRHLCARMWAHYSPFGFIRVLASLSSAPSSSRLLYFHSVISLSSSRSSPSVPVLFYSGCFPVIPFSLCLMVLTSSRCFVLHSSRRLTAKPLFSSGNLVPQLRCYCKSLWTIFLLSPSGTCVIFHSSGYDTQAKVNNKGGTEYGLFQISNKHWCKSSEVPESENICDISCDGE